MATLTRRHIVAGTAALAALAPARAVAQLAAGLERGYVNAADFGLISDSVPLEGDPNAHDQSAALQRAIDASAGMGLPLYLPGGYYGIANVTIPSWFTLYGVRGATHLQAIGDNPILKADSATTVTLRDLVLDGTVAGGNEADPGLLVLRDCEKLEIDGVRFVGGIAGVHLERTGGRIESCLVEDSRDTGIFAIDSAGLSITGNRIGGCGNGGIRVWASDDGRYDGTLVSGNEILDIRTDAGGNGQNGNGINVFRAAAVTLVDNRMRNCAFSAIRLNATTDCIVSGNTCLESGEVAIFSEFGFSGSVIADNIVDGAAQGISITNFNEGGRLASCTGNIVRNIAPRSLVNPDTTPAGIFAEADTVIANNVVESVPGLGIGAGWGPYLRDVAITGNLVRDTEIGIGVSVAPEVGKAIVTGNRVSGARRAGIAGLAWTEVESDDLARDAGRYPAVTISGNSVG